MKWSNEAVDAFTELLGSLPSSLRARVEKDAGSRALTFAEERKSSEVTESIVAAAMMACTPGHMRARVEEAIEVRERIRAVK